MISVGGCWVVVEEIPSLSAQKMFRCMVWFDEACSAAPPWVVHPAHLPCARPNQNRNPEPTQRAYAFTSEWRSFVIRPWKSTVLGLRPVLLPRFHHMLSSTLPKRYCHSSSSPPPVKKLKWAGANSEEKYHRIIDTPSIPNYKSF